MPGSGSLPSSAGSPPNSAPALAGIDDHFWDWALWLRSKLAAGRHDTVAAELRKLHQHLLGPMGVIAVPASLDQAVAGYRSARGRWETRLQTRVSRAVENTVMPALRP